MKTWSKDKKSKKWIYNGIEFDSAEEIWFYFWLIEARLFGVIQKFDKNTESFILAEKVTYNKTIQLKTKSKNKEVSLLQQHYYTPDFIFNSDNIKLSQLLYTNRPDNLYFIDVKAGYGVYNNHREFSINQKWFYKEHNIYVNKLDPVKFFKLTWLPERLLFTATGRPSEKEDFKDLKTFKESYFFEC